MNDEIRMYFERFGTVKSVEVQQEESTNTHIAFIEFKFAGAAVAVLSSKRAHRIDGHKVQVKAAEPWQQPDHILNALNDDCLRSILLPLNLSDLTSAANVCLRFNEQAKSVFSIERKKKLALTDGNYEAAKASLQTFGSLAQSVHVDGSVSPCSFGTKRDEFETEFLNIINNCCTSQLIELQLDFELTPNSAVWLMHQLTCLKRFRFKILKHKLDKLCHLLKGSTNRMRYPLVRGSYFTIDLVRCEIPSDITINVSKPKSK